MKKLSLNLSKLLPRFTRPNHQPTSPPATKIQAAKQPPPVSAAAAIPQPQPSAPPASAEMLDSITTFLRRHLICDDYQFTLLALWIVHTWCFRSFPTATYLDVRSIESQSGKTLCLKLLAALSDSPLLACGAHWRSILDNLLTPDRRVAANKPAASLSPHTFLFDDCHHTFAPSERQRVLGLLNSGSRTDCTYIDGLKHYSVFGPKAFAANAPLPRSLASRCIPIRLRRKKPSDLIVRFNPGAAASLARSIQSWALTNSAALGKIGHQLPARLPAGLTARQQDCAEPLLHIADRIGGPWPERARAALVAAFRLADDSLALELLGDIRAIFYLREDPLYIPTRDLLDALIGAEHRPWSAWRNGSGSGRRLSFLLHPFGIYSKSFTKGSSPSFKGYLREAFLDPWERYLPPIPADWPEQRAAMKKEAEIHPK